MTNSEQAIREFVDKWGFSQDKTDEGFLIDNDRTKQCLSDLTALISEHYVAKEEVEKMVSERLREELMAYDKFLSNTYWGVIHVVKRDEAVDEYLKTRESHE